jgi:hypothetical protein
VPKTRIIGQWIKPSNLSNGQRASEGVVDSYGRVAEAR